MVGWLWHGPGSGFATRCLGEGTGVPQLQWHARGAAKHNLPQQQPAKAKHLPLLVLAVVLG